LSSLVGEVVDVVRPPADFKAIRVRLESAHTPS
jgi:hypothetical protein